MAVISIVILFVCNRSNADTTMINIMQPGLEGMISAGELQPGQMRYGLNVDNFTFPGQLRNRKGLQQYGALQAARHGYYGYMEARTGKKFVVGIGDSLYTWSDYDNNTWAAVVGQLYYSDTNRTELANAFSGRAFAGRETNYDWTAYKDLLFLADGKGPPLVVTSLTSGKIDDSLPDSIAFAPRVMSVGLEAPGQLRASVGGLGPLSGGYVYAYAYTYPDSILDSSGLMGPPSAPVYPETESVLLTGFDLSEEHWSRYGAGNDTIPQLLICRKKLDGREQWVVVDTIPVAKASSFGSVIYLLMRDFITCNDASEGYRCTLRHRVLCADSAFTFTLGYHDTTGLVVFSYTGDGTECQSEVIEAIVDSVNNSALADSLTATYVNATALMIVADPPAVAIYVDTVYHSSRFWRTEDTGFYSEVLPLVFIDTVPGDAELDQFDFTQVHTSFQQPGQFYQDTLYDTTLIAGSHYASLDSNWIAYSYWDPVTNMESPLGPGLWTTLVDTLDGPDSLVEFGMYSTCIPAPGRPGWIRIYQNVMDTGFYGHGTEFVHYGLFEQRLEDTAVTMILGNWSDDHVAVYGLDTSEIEAFTLYDYQVMRTATGDTRMHPPYVWDLQIPFSSMAVSEYRMYGAGDPLNPSYLYYSEVDKPYVWFPFNFMVVGDDLSEEIIKIEESNGQIVVFTANGVWLLEGAESQTSFDPTAFSNLLYSAELVRQAGRPGALAFNAILDYRDDIYWFTPDWSVWSVRKGLISAPVADRIDSLFGPWDIEEAASYARLVARNNLLHLVHDSTGECLVYHIPSGTWPGNYEYVDYVPRGTFFYDSTAGVRHMAQSEISFDTAANYLMRQYRSNTMTDELGEYNWAAEFHLGIGWRYLEAQEFQVRRHLFSRRNWLRYQVRSEEGHSLAEDSVYCRYADDVVDTIRSSRVALPRHEPQQSLYLRLYGQVNDTVAFIEWPAQPGDTTREPAYTKSWIEWIRVMLRDHGTDPIEGTGDSLDEEP